MLKNIELVQRTFCAPGWSRATFTFTVVCPKDGCRRFFFSFLCCSIFLAESSYALRLVTQCKKHRLIGSRKENSRNWWFLVGGMVVDTLVHDIYTRSGEWLRTSWKLKMTIVVVDHWWWQRRPKVERKKQVESKTGTLCQRRCHRKNFIFKFKADAMMTIGILKRLSQPLSRESKTTWVELRKVSCCALSTKSWQKHFGHRCPVQLPCHA